MITKGEMVMKMIIKGKKYDTETAEFLGSDSHLWPNDLDFWKEELYRKKTGEFFLYGEGGARSKYGKEVSTNSWSGSETIIPLTEDRARNWAENHLSVEKYEEIFGEVEE
jgi:hypothetical protein